MAGGNTAKISAHVIIGVGPAQGLNNHRLCGGDMVGSGTAGQINRRQMEIFIPVQGGGKAAAVYVDLGIVIGRKK